MSTVEVVVCTLIATLLTVVLIGLRSPMWARIVIATLASGLAVVMAYFFWGWSTINIDSGEPYDGDKTFPAIWSVVTAVSVGLTLAAACWRQRREALSWYALGWSASAIWLVIIVFFSS